MINIIKQYLTYYYWSFSSNIKGVVQYCVNQKFFETYRGTCKILVNLYYYDAI